MRYLASNAGTAHVVSKDTTCPVVKKNAEAWKGQRSLKPKAVLEGYKDCSKCQTFEHAQAEVDRAAENAATADANMREVNRFNRSSGPQPLSKKPAAKRATGPKRDVTPQAKADNWPVADERTTLKVKEHIAIAEEHGWSVSVAQNERRGLTLTATKGEETAVLAYRENGILWNDEIVFRVPGRKVPMHNSGTWRRQVSLPEGQRPISARPKRFGRKASPEDVFPTKSANGDASESTEEDPEAIPLNKSSLPFLHDADDVVIIDALKGRTLYWRNNMMAKVVSAQVPTKPKLIRFGHTKSGRRFVSFPEAEMSKDGEIYGPERAVAIDDMLRVR